jgi:hypothetical protein
MPTVADVKPLHETLLDLTLGEFLAHQALTVVPLLASPRPEPDWLTLAEAGGKVTITEVSEGGSVPVLGVTNDADQALLLLDGEELVGAKQNRIFNTTVLVGAHATLQIPVSCVEQGRWSYRSRHFGASDYSLYASLRAQKAARVSESLERGAGHASDQNEIWAGVAETDLAASRKALAPRPGQIGALVFVSGHWVGIDLLPSPALFARAWSRLGAGYAADALGARARRPRTVAAAEILSRLAVAPIEPAKAVGLGDELRLGGTLTGAALIAGGVVAHLMAFPAVSN